jgi:hypothetical protein
MSIPIHMLVDFRAGCPGNTDRKVSSKVRIREISSPYEQIHQDAGPMSNWPLSFNRQQLDNLE